jgi:thioredoxin 1
MYRHYMADLTFTDQNFQEQVVSSSLPVVVDFWAPWCIPCKMIHPIMDELAEEYKGKITIGKMNTDENPQIADQLQIMGMPTVMVFKNGQPVKALTGVQGKQTYKQMIDEVLAA